MLGRAQHERVGRARHATEIEDEAAGLRREPGRVDRRERGRFAVGAARPQVIEARRDHAAPRDGRRGRHGLGDRGPHRVGVLQDLERGLARDALAEIGERRRVPSRVDHRLDLALARLVIIIVREPAREAPGELLPRGRTRELGAAQSRDEDGLAYLEALEQRRGNLDHGERCPPASSGKYRETRRNDSRSRAPFSERSSRDGRVEVAVTDTPCYRAVHHDARRPRIAHARGWRLPHRRVLQALPRATRTSAPTPQTASSPLLTTARSTRGTAARKPPVPPDPPVPLEPPVRWNHRCRRNHPCRRNDGGRRRWRCRLDHRCRRRRADRRWTGLKLTGH